MNPHKIHQNMKCIFLFSTKSKRGDMNNIYHNYWLKQFLFSSKRHQISYIFTNLPKFLFLINSHIHHGTLYFSKLHHIYVQKLPHHIKKFLNISTWPPIKWQNPHNPRHTNLISYSRKVP